MTSSHISHRARKWAALCALGILPGLLPVMAPDSAAAAGLTTDPDRPDANENLQRVRTALFQDKPILPANDEQLILEAPNRAEDAAIVPIAVRTRLPQSAERYIEKLYLVIDNNPSPLGATFTLTPTSGRADIETRVRVDQYSHVRAIAQTNTGELLMTTRFVKASGGCSAPPGKDQAAAMASLGKMRFKVEGEPVENQPTLAQLMISHPNNSGLVMDQLTRHYVPSHFVRAIKVTYGDETVMSADLDFSISENPNFRFYFIPKGAGELKAEVVDSNDLRFQTAVAVSAQPK